MVYHHCGADFNRATAASYRALYTTGDGCCSRTRDSRTVVHGCARQCGAVDDEGSRPRRGGPAKREFSFRRPVPVPRSSFFFSSSSSSSSSGDLAVANMNIPPARPPVVTTTPGWTFPGEIIVLLLRVPREFSRVRPGKLPRLIKIRSNGVACVNVVVKRTVCVCVFFSKLFR